MSRIRVPKATPPNPNTRERITSHCNGEEPRVSSEVNHQRDVAYSLVAQRFKRLPPMRETRVRSLGREDPLEKEMATHSSILAWRIPWSEEPGGCSPWGHKESDTTE